MPFLNSVTLMGHLAADVEVRQVPSGDTVATFRLGVNHGRSDGKPRKGDFFTCDIWGGWAQNLAKTARKGSLVIVEGRLAQDRWIDAKTNEPRTRVKVIASRVFHVAAQYPDSGGEAGAGSPRTSGLASAHESDYEEDEESFPAVQG
jgi:single stranded DNA-binding protein